LLGLTPQIWRLVSATVVTQDIAFPQIQSCQNCGSVCSDALSLQDLADAMRFCYDGGHVSRFLFAVVACWNAVVVWARVVCERAHGQKVVAAGLCGDDDSDA